MRRLCPTRKGLEDNKIITLTVVSRDRLRLSEDSQKKKEGSLTQRRNKRR